MMNILVLSTFTIICAVAVESRYPYDDSYVPGDIVPNISVIRDPYNRGGYVGTRRPGGYGDVSKRRNIGYGRRDEDALLDRENRRRYKDIRGPRLPPRGIGGIGGGYDYNRRANDRPQRPGYDYGNRRRHIDRPPKRHDDYDYGSYGGGYKVTGIRFN